MRADRAERRRAAPAGMVIMGLALAVLAGCADPGSAGRTSGSAPTGGGVGGVARQVAGRTFLSTSVDGHDLVAGSTIRIEFTGDGDIRAGAGCNSMSGRAAWNGDRVSVDQLAMTEMGCAQALLDQDTWLSGLLAAGLAAAVHDDVLTLTGRGVTLRLTDRRVVDPDRPLQGTLWRLDGIIAGAGPSAAVSSVPQGIVATLRIADGTIHFFDGLNDYDGPVDPSGTLVVGPDTVRVSGDFAGSGVGCASGSTCSVDMSVLTHDFGYQITAGQLTVTGTGPDAGKGLMFVADGAAGTSTVAAPTHTGPVTPSGSAPAESTPAKSEPTAPVPAESAPVASPGSLSPPTSGVTGRTSLGRHDTIPPQPAPRTSGQPSDSPSTAHGGIVSNPLPGHTFRLTGLFTDAGGADTMLPGARFTITFGTAGATADSSCGRINYPRVRYYAADTGPMVDLGDPVGPPCSLGRDPSGVPAGQLMIGGDGGRLFLSTGFVGWWFEPVG